MDVIQPGRAGIAEKGSTLFYSAATPDRAIHNVPGNGFSDSAGLVHLLSNRERDVLRLLAQGESTKEISQMLHVTEGTVRTYRYRIMQKLDITDVARLIHFAVRHQDAL